MGIRGDFKVLDAFTSGVAKLAEAGPAIAAKAAEELQQVANGHFSGGATVTAADEKITIEPASVPRTKWTPTEQGMPPDWEEAIEQVAVDVMAAGGAQKK